MASGNLRLLAGLFGTAALLVAVPAEAGAEPVPAGTVAPPSGIRIDVLSDIMAAWTAFKAHHLDRSGRIVDDANGGISHSEGQGYGMLLAVKLADREAFDAIWSWTSANLGVRADHLFAWKWTPGASPPVGDTNSATDGDILITWALVEAAALWDAPAYLDAARGIARDVAAIAVADSGFGPVLLPGAVGFAARDRADGPVVNLSYWIHPALPALKTAAPDADWDRIFRSGRAILAASDTGPLRLPPEWTSLAGSVPAPAAKFDAVFGYNAIRIPLYLAWSDAADPDLLRRFRGLRSADADLGPFVVEISTGAALTPLDENGFKAVAALVECALSPESGRRNRVRVDGQRQNYYPETLSLLAAIAQLERYPACLD